MRYDAADWWRRAIGRNRAALLRILVHLWFRAGLDEGGAESLPRGSWRAILSLLRPAESAVRRLVIATARDIAVTLRRRAPRLHPAASFAKLKAGADHSPAARLAKLKAGTDDSPAASLATLEAGELDTTFRPFGMDIPANPADGEAQLEAGANTTAWVLDPAAPKRLPQTGTFYNGSFVRPGETPWARTASVAARPSFPLFDAPLGFDLDPRHAPGRCAPRIRSLWGASGPEPAEGPLAGDEIGAAGICRRILALRAALEDLPGHALRFARKRARRDFAEAALLAAFDPADEAQRRAANRFCFTSPMRLIRPPGRRSLAPEPVDEILRECHELALGCWRRRTAGEALTAG